MRVVTCPEVFKRTTLEETPIFLGGGISGCPDWQKEFVARFKDMDDNLVFINPRREVFDMTNPEESNFQITWEYNHLHTSQPVAVVFWFPYNTLCPITLYELGMQIGRSLNNPWHTKLFVGCHPAYTRKFDVEKQIQLAGTKVEVRDNFDDLVSDIKFWYTH